MLAICMEFDKYSNEEVVIERETIEKNVDEPKDLKLPKLKTTKKKNREKVLA
jgi:hypothetical protein